MSSSSGPVTRRIGRLHAGDGAAPRAPGQGRHARPVGPTRYRPIGDKEKEQ
jgi:hypothetical protein